MHSMAFETAHLCECLIICMNVLSIVNAGMKYWATHRDRTLMAQFRLIMSWPA